MIPYYLLNQDGLCPEGRIPNASARTGKPLVLAFINANPNLNPNPNPNPDRNPNLNPN